MKMNMTAIDTSRELKEISTVLTGARSRLARLIPELVEHDIVDYHLSNASLVLSNLSRFSHYLSDISTMLEAKQNDSSG